jgi:hypothetical protein
MIENENKNDLFDLFIIFHKQGPGIYRKNSKRKEKKNKDECRNHWAY